MVVDRLTKWCYFLPFREKTGAEKLAFLFEREIVSQYGWPDGIITNRDTRFASNFCQALMGRMDVKSKLSMAYRPQTDGQTERMNQVIKAHLRAFINFEQDDWVELLPAAQLAYNTSRSETTKQTPFFANFGYEADL